MRLTLTVLALIAFSLVAVPAAHATVYIANLSGAGESPPTSPGTGFAEVTFDGVAHMLTVDVTFSGLLGTTTASHIHAPTAAPLTGNAGVATQTPFFTGFPIGVTSGTYNHTFDTTLASTWNSAYIAANGGTPAGAEAAFATALQGGEAYMNIHTNQFPGGEIRGFLVIPEPSTLALAGIAATGLLARRRRMQRLGA